MIKRISVTILFLVSVSNYLHSQILSVSQGTDLIIKPGTPFFTDSIIFTPSADFTLSNISISRNATVINAVNNPYISRVYKFSAGTNPFSGSIQMRYQDGAELNGLSENTLQLNVHDGASWQSFNSAANDAVNNYVLTNSLSGIVLNELTLAANGFALPLQWRSFVAIKQQEDVLLQWSTFSEHNTKNFIVQTSADGLNWKPLATVTAAGNSNSVKDYSYLHTAPGKGYSFYRIIETDLDGKLNYSVVQKIFFSLPLLHIEILGNPVTNGMLKVRVNLAKANDNPPVLKIYTTDGKLLWKEAAAQGMHSIKVNSFAKGTYLLQANDTIIKFLIQ